MQGSRFKVYIPGSGFIVQSSVKVKVSGSILVCMAAHATCERSRGSYLWLPRVYRGTSVIRKRTAPGDVPPYRRPMPRVLGGSYRGTSITRNVRHKKQSVFWVSRFLIIKKRTPSVLGTFLMNKKWTPSVSAEVLNKD